jgi:hypothetical protein
VPANGVTRISSELAQAEQSQTKRQLLDLFGMTEIRMAQPDIGCQGNKVAL